MVRVWLLVCMTCGCDPAPPLCHFGPEHALFESTAPAFDDVALVWLGRSAVAVFSEATGLYARQLDAQGLPRAPAVRLGPRCDAGVSAAASGGLALVACSRRSTDQVAVEGAVSLYALDQQLKIARFTRFGRVGRGSHGVALAVLPHEVAVAWQDAALDGARIWLTRRPGAEEPSTISESAWYASAPGLVARGAQLYAAWAETRESGRALASRVRLVGLGRHASPADPVTVVTTHDDSPSPELVASEAGLWLAFRDQRRLGRKKTGLYLARLDSQGKTRGEMVRAGRADGVGRPVLRACLGGVVAATPRTFAGDYFVGVVRADAELRTLSGEQQFYEDSHEFAQVASACALDHALLLMAERGRLGSGRAALRSVTFTCD
jgi:hypothetical protein